MADSGPVPHREIIAIAKRWRDAQLGRNLPDVPLLIDVTIALIIAHRNGLPLDVVALMSAPIEAVEHDVGGIFVHVDRKTGTLDSLFQPTYVLKESA